jgi:hypothetical protein
MEDFLGEKRLMKVYDEERIIMLFWIPAFTGVTSLFWLFVNNMPTLTFRDRFFCLLR